MGGGSKGGETKTEVAIPEELKNEAIKNLELANKVSSLPLMHNFGGQVAAFTPQQVAGMQATDGAAASLGLPTAGFGPNTGMNIPGMPQAKDFGGVRAYSTESVFKDAMARVPPEIRQLYEALVSGGSVPAPSAAPASATPGRMSDHDFRLATGYDRSYLSKARRDPEYY